MTLNLSCHLEMLTLERAISIGTCGLAEGVRVWGGEEKEVVDCHSSKGCLETSCTDQVSEMALHPEREAGRLCWCADLLAECHHGEWQ